MSVIKVLEKKTYLTFQLEDELFAVDVLNVLEVLEYKTVTKIPGMPDFVRGIINLRGRVVPIVDLRLKFSMDEMIKTIHTCVIVLDIGSGENRTVIGALADSVKEVFEFEPGQIEPPPQIGTLSQTDYIQGVGKCGDEFIIILNINRVFSTDEVVLLGAAAEEEVITQEEIGATSGQSIEQPG